MAETLNMILVSGAELKKNLKKYIVVIKSGQPVFVKIRGQIVAKLVAVETIDGK